MRFLLVLYSKLRSYQNANALTNCMFRRAFLYSCIAQLHCAKTLGGKKKPICKSFPITVVRHINNLSIAMDFQKSVGSTNPTQWTLWRKIFPSGSFAIFISWFFSIFQWQINIYYLFWTGTLSSSLGARCARFCAQIKGERVHVVQGSLCASKRWEKTDEGNKQGDHDLTVKQGK